MSRSRQAFPGEWEAARDPVTGVGFHFEHSSASPFTAFRLERRSPAGVE